MNVLINEEKLKQIEICYLYADHIQFKIISTSFTCVRQGRFAHYLE